MSSDQEEMGMDGMVPMVAGTSRMLTKLGLSHNPYVDRTAEKSLLKTGAFYLHSDLQGFKPSETTYIFFGRRGSGKTTIRQMMMQKYKEFNDRMVQQGKSPIFVVNLCRPGHMNDCLKEFMRSVGAKPDNWDAQFAEHWTSNDLADCVLSFAINDMMRRVVSNSAEGKMILESLANNPRSATQFLLLAHIYTREDTATLNALRAKLLPIAFSSWKLVKTVVGVSTLLAAVTLIGYGVASVTLNGMGGKNTSDEKDKPSSSSSVTSELLNSLRQKMPKITSTHLTYAGAASFGLISVAFMQRRSRSLEIARANELCKPVRIADARPDLIESLLQSLFSFDDTADRIRALHIGHSAQQKLELIESLAKGCGYQGLAVFGDCFDEVGLLDPLLYPGALKVFAREVCKNEVLNQGRLHFFFPDARASLDLSTDRIVREARFDRHFVRDLTWSRFQLEDLAERRFNAAQRAASENNPSGTSKPIAKFQDLFKHVSKEDFSGAISKLSTPRELMVFMTELLARVEAHSEDGSMVAAQDMEIAVNKALEQSV